MAVTIRKAIEHKDLLAENRRLLERDGSKSSDADRLCDELAALQRLIAAELEEPLQRLARGEETAEADRRPLLDGLLQAAARARTLAAGLAAGGRA